MKTIKVKISGMHCAACGKVITIDLEELDGVGEIKIDEATKLGEINFDENKTNAEEILGSIKNSGYEGQLLP